MLSSCMSIIDGYPEGKPLTDGERMELLSRLRDSIIRGRYHEPESARFIRLKEVDCHPGMRAIDCFVIYEQESKGAHTGVECRLPLVFFFELHHFMYLDGASL